MTQETRNAIRQFPTSCQAEAAGFRLIDWLRAFTFNEHAARMDEEVARREAQYGLV